VTALFWTVAAVVAVGAVALAVAARLETATVDQLPMQRKKKERSRR
jgi:hypothetical protein